MRPNPSPGGSLAVRMIFMGNVHILSTTRFEVWQLSRKALFRGSGKQGSVSAKSH